MSKIKVSLFKYAFQASESIISWGKKFQLNNVTLNAKMYVNQT